MLQEQEHIINKVFVEVNTKSKKVANEYKNSLETFLQQEIFLMIASYLENAGLKSDSEVQLISKLNIEVDLTRDDTSSFNQERIQQKIKEQILKKLENQIEQPDVHNVVIESKPLIKSKADGFFYFLKEGRPAWWDNSKEEVEFTKKTLFELTETEGYEARFLKTIKDPYQKERLIKQFLDEELQILFLGVYQKSSGYAEILSAITQFKFTKSVVREEVWEIFIKGYLTDEIEKISQNIQLKIDAFQSGNKSISVIDELKDFNILLERVHPTFVEFTSNIDSKELLDEEDIDVLDKVSSEDKEEKHEESKHIEKAITEEEIEEDILSETIDVFKEQKDALRKEKSKKEALVNTDASSVAAGKKEQTEKNINENIDTDVVVKTNKEQLSSLENRLERTDSNKKIEEVLNHTIQKTKAPKTYLVQNAGLILLHPFLKQLFTACGFLNESNQIIKPNEAVHLLHYIATKKEQQFESNLLFEKFICNIPIQQPIERNVKLSESIKQQAEDMLKAVLQNWEPLKNSSIDLLRNEFLQRTGKIDLTKEHPHIIVEKKTQDILLDKLPWNYSLCKLPWMNTLIFTDW